MGPMPSPSSSRGTKHPQPRNLNDGGRLGASITPTSVAAGGVAHDPIAAGTVVINATASGFTTRPGGTVTVTINP